MLYFAPSFAFLLLGLNSYRVTYHGWLSQSVRQLPFKIILYRITRLIGIAIIVFFVITAPFLISGLSIPITPHSVPERLLAVRRILALSLMLLIIFFMKSVYRVILLSFLRC